MSTSLSLQDCSVLVVEDNADTLEATAHLIETAFGCKVLTASSSGQALAHIDGGTPIDLLFVNVVLPDTDGVRLAALAKERLPNVAIDFVTEWQNESEIDSIIEKGYVALLKPYSIEQLQAVFKESVESADASSTAVVTSAINVTDAHRAPCHSTARAASSRAS